MGYERLGERMLATMSESAFTISRPYHSLSQPSAVPDEAASSLWLRPASANPPACPCAWPAMCEAPCFGRRLATAGGFCYELEGRDGPEFAFFPLLCE